MNLNELSEKTARKLRWHMVSRFRDTKLYPWLYRSYWHEKFHREKNASGSAIQYFAARPNPGAGIGHQLANWIAGYWFAQQFGLKYAHIPFSSRSWDEFLGFGDGEKTVSELKKEGYHVVRVPMFDENDQAEVQRIREIIASYAGKRVVFLAEQDQFYKAQYGVMKEIQEKFYHAQARKKDKLIYKEGEFNLALHVRRGDIVSDRDRNPNLAIRYQGNEYFVNALKTALQYLNEKEKIHIYLFSQGTEADFPEFKEFQNLTFCLDMGAQESFLHMVYADALITSKSSFSYKPALLNRGLRFCPANFWHGYPDSDDWILLDEAGKMQTLFGKYSAKVLGRR